IRDNALQESLGLEHISTGAPDSAFKIRFPFSHCMKGKRNCSVGFVEVGNVIHEREHLPCVNKAESRRISSRYNRRMTYAIQTTIRGRQSTIDRVCCTPLVSLVCSSRPLDARCPPSFGICLADADALLAAYLP